MKMFLTRLGFGSQIVVTGDTTQIDLPGGSRSGLLVVQDILEGVEDVHFAQLTSTDVVRHRLVSDIVDAYSRWDAHQPSDDRLVPNRADRRAAAKPPQPKTSVMSIEICNESGVVVDESTIVSVARFALDAMRVNPLAELSVLLVELDVMAELHQRWMELPGPTDVMSFPMDELDATRRPDSLDDPESILGDIVLCPEFAKDQAKKAGHPLADELHLLTVHGVLHLLGYDHAEPDQEREMFGLQNELLDRWRADRAAAEARERQRAADSHVLGTVGLDEE